MVSSMRRRLDVLSASIAPANSAGSRFSNPEDWALPTHPSTAEPSSGCKLVCGTNNFGTRITDVAAVLQRLTELGISEIDTARAYNAGKSEEVLGAALPSVTSARELPLGSKVTWMKLGYEQVKTDLAASLKALGRSRLDIYYLHAPDHTASLMETLRAVHECHQEGLFEELGISNFRGWQLLQIIQIMKEKGWGPLPTVYQGAYNAVQRDAEKDILPLCRLNGMRFYGYSPLARGVCILSTLPLPLCLYLSTSLPLCLSVSLPLCLSVSLCPRVSGADRQVSPGLGGQRFRCQCDATALPLSLDGGGVGWPAGGVRRALCRSQGGCSALASVPLGPRPRSRRQGTRVHCAFRDIDRQLPQIWEIDIWARITSDA